MILGNSSPLTLNDLEWHIRKQLEKCPRIFGQGLHYYVTDLHKKGTLRNHLVEPLDLRAKVDRHRTSDEPIGSKATSDAKKALG